MAHTSTLFPVLGMKNMAEDLLMRLQISLNELKVLSREGGGGGAEGVVLAQQIDNELKWLKIEFEYVYVEPTKNREWIIDARKIVYDADQFLKSTCRSMLHSENERDVVLQGMFDRYDKMASNYESEYHLDSKLCHILTTTTDIRDWLHHEREGLISASTTGGGGQVVDVAKDDEDEDDFVGLEEQVDLLVSQLVVDDQENSSSYKVFCICGMVGLGKTAIAKAIYNHPAVRRHFRHFSWTSMSNERHEDKDILYDILSDLWHKYIQDSCGEKNKPTSSQRRFLLDLRQQRSLIVLDGVWSADGLGVLMEAVSKGWLSTILVTSRNSNWPYLVSLERFVYVPRFLTEDESWELLHKKAFTKQGAYVVDKSVKELIGRCGGLPLAIIELGELLASEDDKSLQMVPEKFKSFPMEGRVLEALATSYNELPDELRSCFLYFRNFHPNFEIESDKLCQLWIAENMISLEYRPETKTTMDVARYYLEVLASRSMVQRQVDESTGQLRHCGIHTLLRDLCFLKGKVKDGLLQVMDIRSQRVDKEVTMSSSSSSIREINKLAIYLGDLNDLDNYVPPKREIAHKFHSILFSLQKYFPRSRISRRVESHLSDFKLVKVLDLGGLVFSKLDKSIGKLKCLKYLGLRYTVFHELPSTIANLKDLQTLDLWDDNSQFAFTKIANVLYKLSELRHLYLRSVALSNDQSRRLRLDGLSKLETLENFDSRAFKVKNLFQLTNLRKLGVKISNKSDLETISSYLKDQAPHCLWHLAISIKYCDLYSEEAQSHLGTLLSCAALHELNINGRTGKFPGYNDDFSQCLAKITLESSELKEDPMRTLEQLPNLRSLFLKWNAFVGEEMVCSKTGFPQLKFLQMHRIRMLEKWRVDEGAMLNLSSLEIISCPYLKMVPDGLQFITTLKKLVIGWMPESFTNRLLRGKTGEDFFKVQHVQSIKIIHHDGTEAVRTQEVNCSYSTQGGGNIKNENTDDIEKDGLSESEPGSSSSPTSHRNTRSDKGKGKAPMT